MEKETKPAKSEVAEKEEKILKFWQNNKIFEKSLEKPAPSGDFVFFDGPPFATGLPHYGHILPGTIKDIIPRYQTMRGKKVLRKWGWDCHGLPIENLVEKEMGFKTKKDIEDFGVENFNDKAKGMVMRYADDWKKIIPRTGRWVDMENDYKTMDTKYTESVWWAFKNLYDKNLIYTAFKSMLLCPHCETTLSNFEVNQGYKDITDISVYVKFKLLPGQKFGDEKEFVTGDSAYILAWTTTPWTLPGNVALAVNKDVEYSAVRIDGVKELLILGSELVEKVLKNHKVELVHIIKGSGLLGLSYVPVFDYYNNDKLENGQNGFKVYHGDFVTTTDGTGIVHIAPAFGEDDLNLGKSENLPFIQHVAFDGTFKKEVTDFAGQKVKPKGDHQKADIEIIKYLAKAGTLFEKEKFIHSYPHCWRCDTPLLNYATTSWFLKVTDLKDRLVKVNEKINWNPPEIGSGRFGKWLEGARDWAISRTRYWGAALPVWQNEAGERTVIGSIADLKDGIGRRNKYILVRHGESESNSDNRRISCKKENKDPLTENGKKKALVSGKKLTGEKIDLIIASPFMRTKETAEIIAGEIGFDKNKIIYDDKLGEISCGEHNGESWNDYRFDKKEDGVESLEDVRFRMMQFMYETDKKYEGQNILIVSHRAPLNMVRFGADGLSSKDILKSHHNALFDNAEIVKCDFVALPHNKTFEIDLHRPYIDDVVLRDKKGEVLKRTPEVFDCWLESGSMSFAQNHYPFENKELFEKKNSPLFPADFICESMDQTRGWFYTTLVLGVGLFDKSPYNQVVVSGMILAEDGRKMSKSLNNYPDMLDLIGRYGADSLRYYLISSPSVKAEDMNFSERGVDEVCKKVIQKTQNVLSFYEMYRQAAEIALPSGSGLRNFVPKPSVLDEWILSRLVGLHKTVTESLDNYQLDKAARPIESFVDDLSTWYLRRSRDRFKSENPEEKMTASYYTAFVLLEFCKIIAPFLPFLAEEIFQSLRNSSDSESVHLEDWPDVSKIKFDADLIEKMKQVRSVVTSALELRQKAGIKVRQPLATLSITEKFSPELLSIIADEVNIKEVKVGAEILLDTNITEELKVEGLSREIIRAIQDVRKKENLNPTETVSLVVSTDDYLKNILQSNQKIISFAVLAKNISYSDALQTHTADIDGHGFSVSVIR